MTYLATYLDALTSTELAEVKAALAAKSPVQVLAQSGAAVTAPANDTNENILATVTIAAGLMGLNDSLRIHTLWSHTNSGNAKTLRYRLGGIAGTQFLTLANTTVLTQPIERLISNRNSLSSQVSANVGNTGWNTSSVAVTTGTINTANAQDLVITAQKATGSETVTLEYYRVELIRAP